MQIFNALSPNLYARLVQASKVAPHKFEGRTNKTDINPQFYRYKVIDSHTARKDVLIDGPELYRAVFNELKLLVPNLANHVVTRVYFNLQHFGMESLTHRDCPEEYSEDITSLVYIVPEWREDWGGELLVQTSSVNLFYPYTPNSVVAMRSKFKHKVGNVSKHAEHGRLALIIKSRPNSVVENFLSSKAFNEQQHGQQNFQQHLLRTGYSVKNLATESEDTINAAFLHAVLGTEFFTPASKSTVEELTALFSAKTIDLVIKFSTLPRAELLLGIHGEELKVIAKANEKCN